MCLTCCKWATWLRHHSADENRRSHSAAGCCRIWADLQAKSQAAHKYISTQQYECNYKVWRWCAVLFWLHIISTALKCILAMMEIRRGIRRERFLPEEKLSDQCLHQVRLNFLKQGTTGSQTTDTFLVYAFVLLVTCYKLQMWKLNKLFKLCKPGVFEF